LSRALWTNTVSSGLRSIPEIEARVALIAAVGPVALLGKRGGMKYNYAAKTGKLQTGTYRKRDVLYDLRNGRLAVPGWKRIGGAFGRREACRQCGPCVRRLSRTESDPKACGKCAPCSTRSRSICALLECERLKK
jgi:hypothetical protein